jgi:hypothetical protein
MKKLLKKSGLILAASSTLMLGCGKKDDATTSSSGSFSVPSLSAIISNSLPADLNATFSMASLLSGQNQNTRACPSTGATGTTPFTQFVTFVRDVVFGNASAQGCAAPLQYDYWILVTEGRINTIAAALASQGENASDGTDLPVGETTPSGSAETCLDKGTYNASWSLTIGGQAQTLNYKLSCHQSLGTYGDILFGADSDYYYLVERANRGTPTNTRGLTLAKIKRDGSLADIWSIAYGDGSGVATGSSNALQRVIGNRQTKVFAFNNAEGHHSKGGGLGGFMIQSDGTQVYIEAQKFAGGSTSINDESDFVTGICRDANDLTAAGTNCTSIDGAADLPSGFISGNPAGGKRFFKSTDVFVTPTGAYSTYYSNPITGFDTIWDFDYTLHAEISSVDSSSR